MYVCMYVCMYVRIHVGMYVRTHVCMYAYIYVCACRWTESLLHTHTHVPTHAQTHKITSHKDIQLTCMYSFMYYLYVCIYVRIRVGMQEPIISSLHTTIHTLSFSHLKHTRHQPPGPSENRAPGQSRDTDQNRAPGSEDAGSSESGNLNRALVGLDHAILETRKMLYYDHRHERHALKKLVFRAFGPPMER
jgi:hypothetical protein